MKSSEAACSQKHTSLTFTDVQLGKTVQIKPNMKQELKHEEGRSTAQLRDRRTLTPVRKIGLQKWTRLNFTRICLWVTTAASTTTYFFWLIFRTLEEQNPSETPGLNGTWTSIGNLFFCHICFLFNIVSGVSVCWKLRGFKEFGDETLNLQDGLDLQLRTAGQCPASLKTCLGKSQTVLAWITDRK